MNAPFHRSAVEGEAEVLLALQARLVGRGAARRLAKDLGVSEPYISSIKNGTRAMPPKVARALGFRRRSRWERLA